MTGWKTVKQVAQELRLGERRVQQLCETGEIYAEKVAGVWLIPATGISEYVQKKFVLTK